MRPLIVLSAVIVACLAASGSALAAERKGGTPPVVSPRSGQVEDHTARLRVRAGERATLRVRLNGDDVSEDFGESRRGIRTLDASVSQGLRHGRNVLRVTVQRPTGRARRQTVRFTVPAAEQLVGAGRDRRAVVGRPIELTGRVAGDRESMRWKVIDGPHGRLASAGGRTADFTPIEPGTYTLRLRTGAVSDTVQVDAGQGPLVPIDTQTTDPHTSKPAIEVGGAYYDAESSAGIQVLVLDRKTLKRIENNTFTYVADVETNLSELNDAWLVIAAQHGQMNAAMTGAFTSIGVPSAQSTTDSGAAFSAIGVPGLAEGQANWVNGTAFTAGEPDFGQMTGYLSPDAYDNYQFIPTGRSDFSYGGAVGSPCRPNDPGGICADKTHAGFLVTVRDRHTLDDVKYLSGGPYQFFNTNGAGLSAAQQTAQAQSMISMLSAVRPHDVVTVQGFSTAPPSPGLGYSKLVGSIDTATMKVLARAVMNLGGTRDAFNGAAANYGPSPSDPRDPDSHGQTYMLVGWMDQLPDNGAEGTGAEAADRIDGVGYAPALSGTLRPNNAGEYRPMQASRSPGVTGTLDDLVMAPPTDDWPLENDPGAMDALSWLGDTEPRLGPDPRTAYWTQPLDQSDTNAIIEDLRDQTYPDEEDFSKAEFTTARKELIQELKWVGTTRAYLAELSQPFAGNALNGWADAQTIADTVYNNAFKPADPVTMEWLEFTSILIGFAGTPGNLLGRALQFGMWAYDAAGDGGPGVGVLRTTADKLGAAFVTQANAAEATFESMGDVIVSDYAKLKEVGTYGGCNADATGCPPELAYGTADRKRASADVYRAIEAQAYTKLLPLGYGVWFLAPSYQSGGQRPDVHDYVCNAGFKHPFIEGYPPAAYQSFLQELDPSGGDHSVFEMYALSTNTATAVAPPDAILNRMFGPLSPSGDPRAGGLGMTLDRLVRSTTPKNWSATACDWDWGSGR